MTKTILGKYELNDQNEVIIDISVKKVEDLINSFDKNTPYTKKELRQEFLDFIIDIARETEGKKFILRITLVNLPDNQLTSCIENGLQSYFNNMKDLENRSIEKMIGRFFKLFGLGTVLLFLAILFNRFFSASEGIFTQIFYEGLTITGWVSLWAAIVTISIKWPPQKENIKLYEKLMKAQVILRD